ncbi:acyl-CoA N-acyltransferase [Blastocladiella britannica]|nr:acyl-CoA N-acyltransferase [Blastocladiella britannica]
MAAINFRRITSEADLKLAFAVRNQVFVLEQKCDPDAEFDSVDRDKATDHFLAIDTISNEPLGTCRAFPSLDVPGAACLGRMACLATSRGRGVGKALCLLAHDRLRERGFDRVVIHAQQDKEGFYAKIGYVRTSPEVFYEEGIPHIWMEMRLAPAPPSQ